MPKGRLKRLESLKPAILDIVEENIACTTTHVITELKKTDLKVTWVTVQSYLEELAKENQINKILGGSKGNMVIWKGQNI